MERPWRRCVAADCKDSEVFTIADRSAAGRAGVKTFVAGEWRCRERDGVFRVFSNERLAAVAMRANVTGSPLYAGLWRGTLVQRRCRWPETR